MGKLHYLWCLILDIIGPRHKWPRGIPGLFWKKTTLKNKERFQVCCFTYVNGLDRNILLRWCSIRELLSDSDACEHIHHLYDKFEYTSDYDNLYWSWNVAMGVDQYINGGRHYY
ncbi:unnamed protein product [Meganyctiphanes norvegica]|uniref:Uncharacterized protein n=1 Tax=Meganyctiphanes norvegica TaxID=48144 RepID=A0AAV2QQ95_MEGNR